MDVDIRYGCSEVDWDIVSETLKQVGMAYYEPERHRRAFEASYTTVFAYAGEQLIGFGRAISDGVYQAAIYDLAVVPKFQGQRLGSRITKALLLRLERCNVILYAAPGKETFYTLFGFRKMKTGMALFKNAEAMGKNGVTE